MHLIARPLLLPSLIFAGALAVGALAAVPASAAVDGPASPAAAAGRGPAAPAASLCPDAETTTFGPNVCVFTRHDGQAADPGRPRRDLHPAGAGQRPVRQRPLRACSSSREPTARPPTRWSSRSATTRRSPASGAALGHRHQRRYRGFQQPVRHRANGNPTCNSDDNFWRSMSNLELNVGPAVTRPGLRAARRRVRGACCANSDRDVVGVAGHADPPDRSSTAASSSRTTARATTTPAAASSPTAMSTVTSTSTATSSTSRATAPDRRHQRLPDGPVEHGLLRRPRRARAGLQRAVAQQNTVLATSPVTEEEPFLYPTRAGSYSVFVPSVQQNSSGDVLASGTEAGRRCRCRPSSSPTRAPRSRRSTWRSRLARTWC